jgi:hypothetical protein
MEKWYTTCHMRHSWLILILCSQSLRGFFQLENSIKSLCSDSLKSTVDFWRMHLIIHNEILKSWCRQLQKKPQVLAKCFLNTLDAFHFSCFICYMFVQAKLQCVDSFLMELLHRLSKQARGRLFLLICPLPLLNQGSETSAAFKK